MGMIGQLACLVLIAGTAMAETCTTQSKMVPADRDAIAVAMTGLAQKVQAGDGAGVRNQTIAVYAAKFDGIAAAVAENSPKLKGQALELESIWLLDASSLSGNADAQFFCSLNGNASEVGFTIHSLPAGKYSFGILHATGGAKPIQAAFLLKQESSLMKDQIDAWKLAGFYVRPLTAAGHDGLWYWTNARTMLKQKQNWNAWFYFHEAYDLLTPVDFMSTPHLDKLLEEMTAAAPPAVAQGVSVDAPFVVKGADGGEYHIASFTQDDSLGKDKIDLVLHLKVDSLGDAVSAKKRNTDAAKAMVAAFPELRQAFHGVWVSSEVSGQSAFATEEPMENLR